METLRLRVMSECVSSVSDTPEPRALPEPCASAALCLGDPQGHVSASRSVSVGLAASKRESGSWLCSVGDASPRHTVTGAALSRPQ